MSAEQESMTFTYSKLPIGDNFRYLILEPGSQDDALRCSLAVSTLDEAVVLFEAISYVWGSDIKSHGITCEGRVLNITANLHAVLKHFRLTDRPRNLWADGICINQDDDFEEKEGQVAIMAKIYAAAERVLIYIEGEDNGYAEQVRTLTEEMYAWINGIVLTLGEPISFNSFPQCELDDPLMKDSRWRAVGMLLDQPWFNRGWVVQEACLSRQISIYWSSTELNWDHLMSTTLWTDSRGPVIFRSSNRIVEPVAHIAGYERRNRRLTRAFGRDVATSISMPFCLVETCDLLFSNSRDKIYAMMNLPYIESQGCTFARPNYTIAAVQVFRDFAAEHVRQTQSLEILDFVAHTAEVLCNKEYSWVPQWQSPSEVKISTSYIFIQKPRLLSREKSTTRPSLIEDDTVLRVQGVVFDSVKYASETLVASSDDVLPEMVVQILLRIWKAIEARDETIAYERKRLLDTFLRVVTRSRYRGSYDAWRNSEATVYQELLRHSTRAEILETPSQLKTATPSDPRLFTSVAGSHMNRRKIILTKRGYIGLAPHVTQEGDVCAVVFGCLMPCILRESDAEGRYVFVGSTYIPGRHGNNTFEVLGSEESKDWTEMDDVEEQNIDLC